MTPRPSLRINRLAALASLCLFAPCLASAAERPGVLTIVVDYLNDWIGCLGRRPQSAGHSGAAPSGSAHPHSPKGIQSTL